jgi:hypothetical protein
MMIGAVTPGIGSAARRVVEIDASDELMNRPLSQEVGWMDGICSCSLGPRSEFAHHAPAGLAADPAADPAANSRLYQR